TLICVGALYLVLHNVSLNDVATLADENNTQVEITNWKTAQKDPRLNDPETLGEVVVEIDHPPGRIALGDLHKKKDGSPDFQIGLWTVLQSSNRMMLLLSLLLFAPVALIQSFRFTLMVRAQEIDLSYWEGIKLSYAGNFLNFVAIGSTGGDIFKAYYVACHTDRKTEAVTTVFLDRAVGLISLILIAAVAMCVKFDDPHIREWWPVIGGLGAAMIAGIIVVFSRRVRDRIGLDRLIAKLPFSDHIKRIDAATVRMRHHKKLLLVALGMTLLLQGIAITSMIVAARGLGMEFSIDLLAGYYVYIALALLIAAIPITPQGAGTMDGALQLFFLGTYGQYSQILFLGVAMRLLQFVWSLPGFIVPITGAHRPSSEKIARLQALATASES
ncbi:MAG: flippase-like domain-containing protein, partial [Planctomycetes bacterium]|nr:flippase-like domain-containing protein [Planctomycetota bacterium]